VCRTITKDQIHLPHQDFTNSFFASNRNGQTIRSLSQLYNHGRMGGTGYLSILPVDQGEHTAGSSFTPNPIYFDPENHKVSYGRDAMLSLLQWAV
jgi:class I fructose-bisphosphate aldolase